MDLVFVAAIAALWGLLVLLVHGFVRLQSPAGSRS